MDSVDGIALERAAGAVWESGDVLAAAAGMGRERCAAGSVAGVPGGLERSGEDPLGRVFRRWQFRAGQKRGLCVGKTKRGKGTKWMVLVDGHGTPLGAHLDSASPAEVKLLEKTLGTVRVGRAHHPGRPRTRPERLILDRGYDSNALRRCLAKRGIEPIIRRRSNNSKATHQDGRRMRRYRRRWIVERTFAWLGFFRRLVVRYDRLMATYAGFFHIACAMLTLRVVLK